MVFPMESALSILGLVLASASAIWLLCHEISEKNKNAAFLARRRDLLGQKTALKITIRNIRDNFGKINRGVHPSGVYAPDAEHLRNDLAGPESKLVAVEADLEALDDADKAAANAWPSVAHILGFGLLLMGFALQLIAEILKAVAAHAHTGITPP